MEAGTLVGLSGGCQRQGRLAWWCHLSRYDWTLRVGGECRDGGGGGPEEFVMSTPKLAGPQTLRILPPGVCSARIPGRGHSGQEVMFL